MDRGAWRATVCGVAKTRTGLKQKCTVESGSRGTLGQEAEKASLEGHWFPPMWTLSATLNLPVLFPRITAHSSFLHDSYLTKEACCRPAGASSSPEDGKVFARKNQGQNRRWAIIKHLDSICER